MTKRTNPDPPALFGVPPARTKAGPVYQGVCKQIRSMIAAQQIDRNTDAGTIAQARSVAASIDRVSGHDGSRQASGMQLAALHAQLDQLIGRLIGDQTQDDAFAQLIEELNGHGTNAAEAPHTPTTGPADPR